MEVIEETVNGEISKGEHSWHPVCCKDGGKSVLEDNNEEETNLFALTSGLSWVGEKTEENAQSLQSESHRPNSALISSMCQVIATSASVLLQYQRLSFAGEEDIVEMEEADILAEHSHLCSICGKEFRRDGNVRIHMRSHGKQYKSKEALACSRPKGRRSYYSCPFQGCRHNRRHPNFKLLKSMVSLRNHYRRSHCAKMYSCNNCGKEFSFVGDLKTHGNKCGHSTWRCSCALTFSTRNKLLRHVALERPGHKPVTPAPAAAGNEENSTGDDKTPEHSAQDLNRIAVQDSSILTEGLPGYANDQDVLMMGVGLSSIEQSEYGDERMESEFDREGSELYASLFWQNGDLVWS